MSRLSNWRRNDDAPEVVGRKLHHAIAATICTHSKFREIPCAQCFKLTQALVRPVGRFASRAAHGNRPLNAVGLNDAWASLGAAYELFLKEAGIYVPDANPEPTRVPGVRAAADAGLPQPEAAREPAADADLEDVDPDAESTASGDVDVPLGGRPVAALPELVP